MRWILILKFFKNICNIYPFELLYIRKLNERGADMDERLLRDLYKKYYRELYLYLYSLCKNKELAEDLLQETFLKAILSLKDSHTNMRAWLYLVARNLYFNHSKKQKQQSNFDEISDVVSEETDVLDKIIEIDKKRILYNALQSIDRRKSEVLVLQYFCGLKQKEIASALQLSSENVRVLSLRGKRELKEYMEENGYEI